MINTEGVSWYEDGGNLAAVRAVVRGATDSTRENGAEAYWFQGFVGCASSGRTGRTGRRRRRRMQRTSAASASAASVGTAMAVAITAVCAELIGACVGADVMDGTASDGAVVAATEVVEHTISAALSLRFQKFVRAGICILCILGYVPRVYDGV